MKAEDTSLLTLLGGGQRQFVIPVFQRDYSWTEAQCAQLLSDVLNVAEHPHASTHFIGSVVYVASGDHSAVLPQWLVIDGQQRLTTCTILLSVLRDRLKTQASELAITDSPSAIEEQFLLNKFAPPSMRAKLSLRGDDNVCLQALLFGNIKPDKPHNRVIANSLFFENHITRQNALSTLTGLRRLMIVSVSLKPGQDNPQLIFESLNSTGMALTQADLVRNYVLMSHSEPEQTRLYETYWRPMEQAFGAHYRSAFDSFLRDFVTLEINPPRPLKLDKVYREFRTWYPSHTDSVDALNGTAVHLSRLLRFAQYYCMFMISSSCTTAVDVALRRIQRLVDVAAPTIMVLFERWLHDKVLNEDEIVQSLELLESYVLRRSMVGAETRSAGQIFAALAQRLKVDRPLARLKAALARQPINAEFPDDQTFFHALVSQDLYGRRNLKFLLERLTNSGKEKIHTDNLTIEHVLPQKEILAPEWQTILGGDWKAIRAECVHKLGNLTLTGFNSELEARPFSVKKSHPEWGYVNSPVSLSRSIAAKDRWGPIEIDERSKFLAERALKIWKSLASDQNMLKQVELEEAKERSAGYSVDALKWAPGVESWYKQLRATILACGNGDSVTELPRARSVVYRAPDWFVEIIPRARGFSLRLAADVSDLEDISPDVQDSAAWNFVLYSAVNGGSLYAVNSPEQLSVAAKLVERTYELMLT